MRSSFRLKPICFYLMGVMLYHHSYAEDAGRAGSEAQIQVLEDVHVKAKRVPKDKKVFTDARAVSTRQDIFKSGENLDNIVRSIPGAFTQQDKSSGIVSLNIRGDSGFGRVNTMVDGITQTFYSTSTDAGRAGGSSQFGASVDSNFIAGLDVVKGSFSGSAGINSLAGSANLRTLGVDDVVQGNNTYGLLLKGLTGTNSTKGNAMAAIGARKWLESGASAGVLYGHSRRGVAQNYRVGGGGQHIGNFGAEYLERRKQRYFVQEGGLKFNSNSGKWERDFQRPYWKTKWYQKYNDPQELQKYIEGHDKSWRENLAPQYDITPIDPSGLKQQSAGNLFKLEYDGVFNKYTAQFRDLNTKIGSRKIINRNYQFNYGLSLNPYTNLNLTAAYNSGRQKYPKGSKFTGWGLLKDFETYNNAKILDLNNTATFRLPRETELQTTLGFNYFHNEYGKNRFPEELGLFFDGPDQDNGLYSYLGRFKGDKGLLPQKSTIVQPAGSQYFNTFYFDAALKKDIYRLNYSTNAINYRFGGEYTGYYGSENEFKRAFGENSPAYKEHCDPSCGLYEPVLKKYGKKRANNHSVSISADFGDYFMPFAGYSRTHRMPNIQEMYFSQIGDSGVHTALKPERANTWQFGFNTYKKGLLKQDDILGLKLVGYRSRIDNYIHNVYGKWWDLNGDIPSWVGSTGLAYTIRHRNFKDKVHKHGFELELNYDYGRFFTNLSYAYQKSTQPTNFSDASESPNNASKEDQLKQGYGLSRVSALPRDYGRLEVGTRWLGNKLTLGGAMRYFGKSIRATAEERYIDGTNGGNTSNVRQLGKRSIKQTETLARQPLIFDFYAAYEPKKNLIFRAEVKNLFDRRYIDPLDAGNDAATQRYYSSFDPKDKDEDVTCNADKTLCNGKYGGTSKSVLTNFARGRTFLMTMSYKF
ncbi:TPA: TonB-dependent receptor [Neisseria gonorrhoeae]